MLEERPTQELSSSRRVIGRGMVLGKVSFGSGRSPGRHAQNYELELHLGCCACDLVTLLAFTGGPLIPVELNLTLLRRCTWFLRCRWFGHTKSLLNLLRGIDRKTERQKNRKTERQKDR